MEESSTAKPEEKPFSVLERFRQLKKEKEQPSVSDENVKAPDTSGTVFKSSTSSGTPARGRGRHWKRNFSEGQGDGSNKRQATDTKRIFAELHEGQKERDVGITEFLRDGPGFDVILKHRYTDFQVNELDLEGNVVKLTSTDIPEKEKEEPLSEEEDHTILPAEKWAELAEIVDKKLTSTVDIDVTDFGKEQRQRIHKAVKRRFGIHIYSNTQDIDNRKVMKIGTGTANPNYRFCSWPKGRPEYLHFVLYKENIDMSEAINVLGRISNIKSNKFSYAGTKDKRAVTTQRMCVRRGDVNRFKRWTELRGVAVGNYSYKWNTLRLGDLKGNRFRIALRNVKASDDVIEKCVKEFKKSGFINYFGLQRFGQSAIVPTYAIGQAILNNDWKLAVELVLKPRPGESSFRDVKEARDIWWETRDAVEALKPLTRKERTIEGKILSGLKKHGPNAYQNAFDNLPRHTVTLYLHSYQSLIWNKVVSRRLRQFGLKVLPGDLVKDGSWEDRGQEINVNKDSEDASDSDDESENGVELRKVRTLTAEEADSASIYDILYPLPGDDIRFPDNEIASWYTELLEEDGHSLKSFSYVNKKYGMYGSYRHMLDRAEDVKWHTLRYEQIDDDLLRTDLDELRGNPPPSLPQEGPHKALVLEFSLKVCGYATMAIRELTKCDTSTSNQARLTNQSREEDEACKKAKLEETGQQLEVDPPASNGVEEPMEQDADPGEENGQPEISDDLQRLREERIKAEADNFINRILDVEHH